MFDQVCCGGVSCRRVDDEGKRPDPPRNEIAEEVTALISRPQCTATIDDSARNRLSRRVVIFKDRIGQRQERGRQAGHIVVKPLAIPPAVVASSAPAGLVIDFFEATL